MTEPDRRAHWLTERYACSRCWAPIVERVQDGKLVVECPNGCAAGFVTQSWVRTQRNEDATRAAVVAANYPDLAPQRTAEQRAATRRALWGD